MAETVDQQDYLGYATYAKTLWARIARALEKDVFGEKDLGDDPLVVGIFGEWGAGKSTLLKLVEKEAKRVKEERIKAHKGDDKFDLLVPVFFQPWKYEHEPHLLVPMLLHILTELEGALKKSETTGGKIVQSAHKVGDWVSKSLSESVGKLQSALKDSKTALAVGMAEPTTGALLAVAGALAGYLGKLKKTITPAKAFEWKDNGRDYYELHEVLRKITRPARYEPVAGSNSGGKREFQVNFVIFIDDLDRCLPEKAVEALELIKTIFNLESFAFVLALDEEVVERGIGHRYQSYVLKDKKPEMPITGFEYLEKIVHLPFRLPALTRGQAGRFLAEYERLQVAPDQPLTWWFAQPSEEEMLALVRASETTPVGELQGNVNPERRTHERARQADLQTLVLNAFDAYVPRKLIRLVELMHQIAAVCKERNRPLSWEPAKAGDAQAVDVRVVLALAMVQLFQPDLYRLMRRRANAFSQLLSSFAKNRDKEKHALSSADVSDVDLWRWVASESTLPHASDSEDEKYHGKNAPDPIARIQRIKEISERNLAEQVRLPMVHLLTQYRATQRHPFDVLKLLKSLAISLDVTGSGPEAVTIAPYLSLLAAKDMVVAEEVSVGLNAVVRSSQGQSTSGSSTMEPSDGSKPSFNPDTRPRFTLLDVQKLLNELVSSQPSIQANLASSNQLITGQVLDAQSAKALADALTVWCNEEPAEKDQRIARYRAGLPYLAPYLSAVDGTPFWQMLNASAPMLSQLSGPFSDQQEVKHAHDSAKLYCSLGQDKRFNSGALHLAASERSKVLENFVKIPATENFRLHSDKVVKNLPEFYAARYLTTVDQYAHFVRDGYGEADGPRPEWWDSVGWLWRNGNWDNKLKHSWAKEQIKDRPRELRNRPMRWEEQIQCGSKPVMRLNWFEARAYTRWLSLQLKTDLTNIGASYQVGLPTEAQWERAARASNALSFDERQYPWAGDAGNVGMHANIDDSGLKECSVVGLFPPSPIGLFDVSGNLWEWQSNLYERAEDSPLPFPLSDLKRGDDFDASDSPALRGGSWINRADDARASIRNWYQPVSWSLNVGFRVVLSIASF